MSRQGWVECVTYMDSAGPTLANSIVATSILNTDAKFTFPALYFNLGRVMRITLLLAISNIVTAPGTFTIDVRLGGTVVWTSGAQQLSQTAHTSIPEAIEIDLTVFTDGSAANFMGQGWALGWPIIMLSTTDRPGTVHIVPLPQTAPAVGGNFDATQPQQLDVFATFSVANAGNAVQVQQYEVEILN